MSFLLTIQTKFQQKNKQFNLFIRNDMLWLSTKQTGLITVVTD